MHNVGYFKFYKTFEEIVDNPWASCSDGEVYGVPISTNYNINTGDLTVKDVLYWEQLYKEPGNVGIYVAHQPFEEFYIIIFFFLNNYIEIYVGENASLDIFSRAKDLGIRLDIRKIWIAY